MAEASDKALLNTWIWSPNGHMASLTEGTVLIDYLFPRKRLIAANLAVITFLVALLTFVIWLFRSLFKDFINFFNRDVPFYHSSNVRQRYDRGRDADREAIKFAFEAWNCESSSFACAGSGWDNIFSCSASFAQIFCWRILETL